MLSFISNEPSHEFPLQSLQWKMTPNNLGYPYEKGGELWINEDIDYNEDLD